MSTAEAARPACRYRCPGSCKQGHVKEFEVWSSTTAVAVASVGAVLTRNIFGWCSKQRSPPKAKQNKFRLRIVPLRHTDCCSKRKSLLGHTEFRTQLSTRAREKMTCFFFFCLNSLICVSYASHIGFLPFSLPVLHICLPNHTMPHNFQLKFR